MKADTKFPEERRGKRSNTVDLSRDISSLNFLDISNINDESRVLLEPWSDEKCRLFDLKLKDLLSKEPNAARIEFNEIVNPSSKGLYVPFSTQLKFLIDKYMRYNEDKALILEEKIFDGKKELATCMHGYALGYLRHLRAFNFNQSCSIASLIYEFVSLLLEDEYESLTRLSKLKEAYFVAWKHLNLKAKDDPELQPLQYF